MREADIEHYLTQHVALLRGEVRKLRWIGRHSAPDRVVMLDGVTVWVELKAPGERPSRRQEREHRRMRNMGQRVEVIDTREKVDTLLDEFTEAVPA